MGYVNELKQRHHKPLVLLIMDDQKNEQSQNISRNLKTLIRGLTQNNVSEMYEGYKALFQIGVPAIPQIREVVLQSNWSKVKYANEVRYVVGLVNLIHDIHEAEARKITDFLTANGCDLAIASVLNSICRFTLADYAPYEVCGVEIFEHRKLVTKQNVKAWLEQWLGNVPSDDVKEIERIYVLRKGDLDSLGSYIPILYRINLVWDNPSPRWSPMSWFNNFFIERILYHEIGHHVHRHTFGQDPEQEEEAEKYSDKILANSNRLVFRTGRFLKRAFRVICPSG